jgi:hypothetical protein
VCEVGSIKNVTKHFDTVGSYRICEIQLHSAMPEPKVSFVLSSELEKISVINLAIKRTLTNDNGALKHFVTRKIFMVRGC